MAPSSYFKGIWIWIPVETSASPGCVRHALIDSWYKCNRTLYSVRVLTVEVLITWQFFANIEETKIEGGEQILEISHNN